MTKVFGKLVRDRIPEIIKKDGKTPHFTYITDPAKQEEALRQKLDEEVKELHSVLAMEEFDEEEFKKEAADVIEVVQALGRFKGISSTEITTTQNVRKRHRGGFSKLIRLDQVED
jgi:predicted house-cleaning noncanonical NTP pyrophosphatase (MazG superfamily)